MSALRNFTHDPGRLAGHDGEARNDHKRGHDSPVQHLDVVLNNGELVDCAVLPDRYVAPYRGGLHYRILPDKDVVSESQRHVCKGAFVQPARRTEVDAPREEAVSADGDRCRASRCCGAAAG